MLPKSKTKSVWSIKLLFLVITAFILSTLIPTQYANAQTNITLNFQGKIVRNGTGVEGLSITSADTTCIAVGADTCNFRARYYTVSSGGTALWSEDFSDVEIGDNDGVFNLALGTGTNTSGTESSFENVFVNNTSVYAEILFDSDGNDVFDQTFDRMAVRAAPFAISAKYLNGFSADGFVRLAPSSVQTDSSTLNSIYINKTGASGNILNLQKNGTSQLVLDNSGNLGLGVSTVAAKLEVSGGNVRANTGSTQIGFEAFEDATHYAFFGWDGNNNLAVVNSDGGGLHLSTNGGQAVTTNRQFQATMNSANPVITSTNTSGSQLRLAYDSSNYFGLTVASDGGMTVAGLGTDADLNISFAGATDGDFSVNNDDLFVDTSTANVGIGIGSTASARLHIVGSADDQQLIVAANATQTSNLVELQSSGGTILGSFNGSGYFTQRYSTISGTDYPIRVQSTSNVDRFLLTTRGQLSIAYSEIGTGYATSAPARYTTASINNSYDPGADPGASIMALSVLARKNRVSINDSYGAYFQLEVNTPGSEGTDNGLNAGARYFVQSTGTSIVNNMYGMYIHARHITSGNTSNAYGVFANIDTYNTGTFSNGYAYYANTVGGGSGTKPTNAYGLYVANQDQATNNYGASLNVSSGTNRWNIYAAGTAQNYFAGNVGIGDTTPDHLLDVAGNIGLNASSYINWGDTDGTTGYGFRDNAGSLEFKDSGGSWTDLSAVTGLWSDGGTYIYPTAAEVLGNSASAGSNKLTGIYLSDSSPLYFGLDNDVNYSFSGTVLAVTMGNNDINFDSNTLFIDGSANFVGIGNAAPAAMLEINGATASADLLILQTTDNSQSNNALEIQTSAGVNSLAVSMGGDFTEGTATSWTFTKPASGLSQQIIFTGSGSIANSGGTFITYDADFNAASGQNTLSRFSGDFAPTSGTAQYRAIDIFPTVNQTGGANGNVSVLRITPYLQASGGANSYLLDVGTNSAADAVGTHTQAFGVTTGGNIGIGVTSPNAFLDIKAATTGSAQLNLTTSGGTNPSSPVSGDLWWNGTQLYFYNGSSNVNLLSGTTPNLAAVLTAGNTSGGTAIDMQNALITNIGNSGTDFTSGGALTLAGALTISDTGLSHTLGDWAVGAASLTAPFSVDESTNTVRFGEGNASFISNWFDASAASGTITYASDTWQFSNGDLQFNSGQNNTDNLTISGDTIANLLYSDSANDTIYLGTNDISSWTPLTNSTASIYRGQTVSTGNSIGSLQVRVDTSHSTGQVTYAAGQIITVNDTSAGGTVLEARGLDISIGGTSIGSAYGLYISDITSSAANYGIYISDGDENYLAGELGIGVSSPSATLDVNGTIELSSLGISGATDVCQNGSNLLSTCSSSLRYKNSVIDLDMGLDEVMDLRSVQFNWNSTGETDLGFIAEEVYQVDPLLTFENADGQLEGVKYKQLTAVLVNAMHEQQAMIDDLQNQINQLSGGSPSGNANGSLLPSAINDLSVLNTLSGNLITANTVSSTNITANNITVQSLLQADTAQLRVISAYTDQNLSLKLGDSDGLTGLKIIDSNNQEVFGVSSDGKVNIKSGTSDASVGSGVISAGTDNVTVLTTAITSESKVFITARTTASGATPLVALMQIIPDGDNSRFIVKTDQIRGEEVRFDWWIIN